MTELTRKQARENAFLVLFAQTFHEDKEDLEAFEEKNLDEFSWQLINGFNEHSSEIDELISANLKGWTLNRISRVCLCALRLGVSEMFYGPERIAGIAINEAVEIAKIYGSETDYQYVNGVLGSIARINSDTERAL